MSVLTNQKTENSVPVAPYLLLIIFLVFMAGYGVLEVIDEVQELNAGNESPVIAWTEIGIVIFSLAMLSYLNFMLFRKHAEQTRLARSLERTRKQLESSNQLLQKGKQDFRKVIDWQFDAWNLTPSEKEVALLLLKGLSIKEIADMRNTHEKTVRKHASAVYEKSGLSGRHLLSAWFFEDLF